MVSPPLYLTGRSLIVIVIFSSQCTHAPVIDFGLLYTFGYYLCEYMHALT